MRPLKQIAPHGEGANWVQARVLDIAAVLGRLFLAWAGSATRAIGAAGLLREPFSPELFLLPDDYNSAKHKKAVVSSKSMGYRSGAAQVSDRLRHPAAGRNGADSRIKS